MRYSIIYNSTINTQNKTLQNIGCRKENPFKACKSQILVGLFFFLDHWTISVPKRDIRFKVILGKKKSKLKQKNQRPPHLQTLWICPISYTLISYHINPLIGIEFHYDQVRQLKTPKVCCLFPLIYFKTMATHVIFDARFIKKIMFCISKRTFFSPAR